MLIKNKIKLGGGGGVRFSRSCYLNGSLYTYICSD